MKPKEIIWRSTKKMWRKWSIAFKIMPLIILVAILKFISHKFGFEIMELNALFTTLIAGTIFLIGFLISGVQKLPSELSGSKKLFSMILTPFSRQETLNRHLNLLNFKNHLLIC